MKAGSKLYGMLFMKCPKCHEGDLFTNRNVYKLKGFFDMPEHCPSCQQKFELETGFFYGSMYLSYAITIALTIALWVGINFFTSISIVTFIVLDILMLLVSIPLVYKLSRSIWIAFFVKYDKDALKH